MLALLLCALQAAPKKADPPLPPFDVAKITARVEELGKQYESAGLVIAVAKDHEVVVERAFGERGGKPLAPESEFAIGTLTHQFTTALALKLVDAGKLALEDDVAKHLTAEEFPPGEGRVNVGQVLAHTSGLGWASKPGAAPFATPAGRSTLSVVREPGTTFVVDAADRFVLQCLVRKLSGARWHELVAKELFSPIGLAPKLVGSSPEATVVVGQVDVPDPTFHLRASELVRWNRAVLEREVVSEKGSRRIMTPTKLADGSSTNWGMALGMRRYGEFKVYSATSSGTSGSARLAYSSLPHVTVVVLSDREAPVERIEREIGHVVLGWPRPVAKDESIEAGRAAMLTGTYVVGGRSLRVRFEGGRLFLDGWRSAWPPASEAVSTTVRLLAQGDGTFLSEDEHEERVAFEPADARAERLTITFDALVWTAKRTE